MSGFGIQGAGLTPAGLGDTGEATPGGGVVFRDTQNGGKLDARRIDPRSKQYVVDGNGRITGMTVAQQAVHLAVSTDLGSAAVPTLGNRLKSIKTIGANFERELRTVYESALAAAVQAGLIQLVGVEVKRVGRSGAFIRVRWRDLTTGQPQTTEVRL